MTPDERNLLTGFLNDLAQARAGTKDAEAETLINRALVANPDAAYLLVQHTILSDQALHQAQDQIAQLQAQLQSQQAPAQSTSFFGGGRAGYGQAAAPTAVPPTGGYGGAPSSFGAPPQGYGAPPPGYGAPPSQPFSSGGGLGSFLRSAGTMAAGVAGGEFLFSGLSGLFGGGHGGGMGGGFGGMGGGFGGPSVENVTVNNYGDDSDDGDDGDDGGDDGN